MTEDLCPGPYSKHLGAKSPPTCPLCPVPSLPSVRVHSELGYRVGVGLDPDSSWVKQDGVPFSSLSVTSGSPTGSLSVGGPPSPRDLYPGFVAVSGPRHGSSLHFHVRQSSFDLSSLCLRSNSPGLAHPHLRTVMRSVTGPTSNDKIPNNGCLKLRCCLGRLVTSTGTKCTPSGHQTGFAVPNPVPRFTDPRSSRKVTGTPHHRRTSRASSPTTERVLRYSPRSRTPWASSNIVSPTDPIVQSLFRVKVDESTTCT